MTGIAVSLVLQAALVAPVGAANTNTPVKEAVTYEEAYKVTAKTGKPLLILVGADWCPACRTMKGSTIPALLKRGDLSKVAFAMVDKDQRRPLATKLMSGSTIPQLIMYSRDAKGGWRREQLNGVQNVDSVRKFIDRSVGRQASMTNKSASR